MLPQSNAAVKPQVMMRNCVFMDAEHMPYVETQFSILSASIQPVKKSNKKYQASYQITLLYLNHSDDTIQQLNYRLHTQELSTAGPVNFDLLDVKRTSLPAGKYRIELQVEDLHTKEYEILSERISIYFPLSEVSFSDAMFLERYTSAQANSVYVKAGYEILPYPVNLFPGSRNQLIFYQEIYQLPEVLSDSVFYITISLQDVKGEKLEQYQHTYKEHTASFIPVLTEMDIKDLKAGQYFLTLTLTKKNTERIAEKKTFIIRTRATVNQEIRNYENAEISGTFAEQLHSDSLFYWLESLSPISNATEKEQIQKIIKARDTINARKFFFSFWHHIAPGCENTEWFLYKQDVDAVEYAFSTQIRHGFETDRGRVYLQYGKPDRRHVMNSEPGALPYEIWQYYRINSGQANVMFVFYLPGLATNDYRLIHSDVNGELRDSRWKYKIYNSMKEMSGYSNPDNTNIRDHWGKRIDQILNW